MSTRTAVHTETCPDTGITLRIEYDDYPLNPRTDHDNLFTFTCFHSRHNLGDDHSFKTPDDLFADLIGLDEFNRLHDINEYEYLRIERTPDILGGQKEAHRQRERDHRDRIETALRKACPIFETLYLYDHSGLTISLGSFSCPWDSGPVGFAYATRAALLNEYSTKRITKPLLVGARNVLKGEVSTYDSYLRGEVYGFVVEDANGEHLDSCWGFIGDEDYCITEGRAALQAHVADAKKAIADEAVRASFAATSGGD